MRWDGTRVGFGGGDTPAPFKLPPAASNELPNIDIGKSAIKCGDAGSAT